MSALIKSLQDLFNQTEEEINFDSFTKFSLFLFRLVFIKFNPLTEEATLKEKIVYYTRTTYNRLSFLVYIWTIVSKIILITHADDLMSASPLLLDVVSYFMNEFKVIYTYSRKDDIWKMMEAARPIFNNSTKKGKIGMGKYLKGTRRLVIIYAIPVFLICFAIALPIIPFLLQGKMAFTMQYWFPFDPYRVERFPFVYLWVNWEASCMLISSLAIDAMLYFMITFIVIEFDVLKIDLMDIRYSINDERSEKVKSFVDRHNKLMELSDKLQDIYSKTFLVNFVISSLSMCFLFFQLSKAPNFAVFAFFSTYLGTMGGQVLLFCVYGQKLIDSSGSIADGILNCGWEETDDIVFKKDIVLMLLRAQKAKRLTAYGFADISVETFAAVSMITAQKIF